MGDEGQLAEDKGNEDWKEERCVQCGVNGQEVEQVEVMKYLGVMISSDGSMASEVEQRIGMASKMIGAIGRTVLGRKELRKSTKLSVSGQCYGDTHLDIWLQSMDSAGKAQGTNRGGTDEGIKEDRGDFQNG